jgi:uncharacterized protein (TIGR00369 family)
MTKVFNLMSFCSKATIMTANPDSDFDPLSLIKMMSRNGHNGFLGVEYHAHGSDWCELALPYNAALVSDAATGIMASGPIITLMDMVTSMAIWFKSRKFQPQATLDLRVDYMRPAKPGEPVIGHGECYAMTRSIAFVRGYAHDGDPERPLAHVAGTFMFTSVG